MTEVSFKRIAIVVEGETELAFVNKILASHLLEFGVLVMPILSGKSGRGGGVRNWDATKRTIVHALRAIGCCSTMIDFYGLPNNWPSRIDAASRPPLERAGIVEDAISKAIIAEMSQSFNPQAFIPYLQLHEFEALAFSDISRLAEFAATISNQDRDDLHAYFQSIIVAAGHPEAINDFYGNRSRPPASNGYCS